MKNPWDGRIQEEVEHHLAELQAQLEAEGLTPREARTEALRRFGDPNRVEAATRAADGGRSTQALAGLVADLRLALRGIRRAPAFALTVTSTLALALGAAVSVFGVVWDVLLRPLDVAEPDSLVVLVERMPGSGIEGSPTSEGTFHDWRNQLTTVDELVAWEWVSRTFEDPDRPEELFAIQMSGNLLEVMGVAPLAGRNLTADDEIPGSRGTTVMISEDFWSRRFGRDPGVVGRSIVVDGTDLEIAGVVPSHLDAIGPLADLFEPGAHVAANPTNRGGRILHVVARLAPGATVDAANAEVAAVTERIAAAFPVSAQGWSAEARPIRDHLLGDVRTPLRVAGIAVALLLLIAVVNVANLMSVRAADTRREMAVRAALGAGRFRLIRMRLAESLVLGLLGAAAGIALATGLQRWVLLAQQEALPRALDHGVPTTAVVFGVVLAVGVGFAAGAIPAVRGAVSELAALGRGTAGGRGVARRSRHVMIVLQFGMTMVLLVGAGLLIRTVMAIGAVDLGFQSEGVVAARVSLDASSYPDGEAQRVYYDALLEQVKSIPGVRAAGLTSALPMDPIAANFDLPTRTDESTPWGEAPQADFRVVTPGLMEALGFRLLAGRLFEDADRDGPLVAIVNRAFADSFWPGQPAVGKRIQNVWRQDGFAEVVGVVEDTRFYGPVEASRTEMFVPMSQTSWGFMTIVASAVGDPAVLERQLEQAVIDIDPLHPPQGVFQVGSLVDATIASERFYATLLTVFALLALGLAGGGVYGVLAYAVRLRTREMGVRMALGATHESVLTMVLRQGLGLVVLGLMLGLVASLSTTRVLGSMLFGVEPLDPVTLVGTATLLTGVALIACLSPAIRASRMDPARVLRED